VVVGVLEPFCKLILQLLTTPKFLMQLLPNTGLDCELNQITIGGLSCGIGYTELLEPKINTSNSGGFPWRQVSQIIWSRRRVGIEHTWS